jgi:hypothetical protein
VDNKLLLQLILWELFLLSFASLKNGTIEIIMYEISKKGVLLCQ